MQPLIVSVPDSAVLLGVSKETMWRKVYSRQIESVKLGARRMIKMSTIEKLINDNTIPAKRIN